MNDREKNMRSGVVGNAECSTSPKKRDMAAYVEQMKRETKVSPKGCDRASHIVVPYAQGFESSFSLSNNAHKEPTK